MKQHVSDRWYFLKILFFSWISGLRKGFFFILEDHPIRSIYMYIASRNNKLSSSLFSMVNSSPTRKWSHNDICRLKLKIITRRNGQFQVIFSYFLGCVHLKGSIVKKLEVHSYPWLYGNYVEIKSSKCEAKKTFDLKDLKSRQWHPFYGCHLIQHWFLIIKEAKVLCKIWEKKFTSSAKCEKLFKN